MASTSKSGAACHCCEYCKKEFARKSNLDDHRKIHLMKKDFKCSFCEYTTNFKKHLFSHIRSHTKERPYKCDWPNCKAAFSYSCGRIEHQKTVHQKHDDSLKKFACAQCPYKTPLLYHLNRHLKTHSEVREFFCDLCPYVAKHKPNLSSHHKSVHLKLQTFKCQHPNCNSAFSLSSHLKQHQITHNKMDESLLKFKCLECDYKTGCQSHLKQHFAVHSEVKSFACDLCPFRSKHKHCVKLHKSTVHSKIKPFKCPQMNCSHSCKTNGDLTKHMKVHSDYKEFACSFPSCGYRAKRKCNLKGHELTHRNEKPFKCNLCAFKCSESGALCSHIRRRHTGESPYPCKSCPYRGKNSTDLKSHVQRRHVGN